MPTRAEEKERRRQERLAREFGARKVARDDDRWLWKFFAKFGAVAIVLNLVLLAAAVAIVLGLLKAFGVL
jgi:hypothetical protein